MHHSDSQNNKLHLEGVENRSLGDEITTLQGKTSVKLTLLD